VLSGLSSLSRYRSVGKQAAERFAVFFIPVIDGIVFLAFPLENRSVGTKNRFETSDKRQEFLIPDLLLA